MINKEKARLVDDLFAVGGVMYITKINGNIHYWGYSYSDKNIDMSGYAGIRYPDNIYCSDKGYRQSSLYYLDSMSVIPLMFCKGTRTNDNAESIKFISDIYIKYKVKEVIYYNYDGLDQQFMLNYKVTSMLEIDNGNIVDVVKNNELLLSKYPINLKGLLDWYVITLSNRTKYIAGDRHSFYTVDEYWPEWEVKEQYFSAPFRYINPNVCRDWGSAICMANIDKEDDDDVVEDVTDRELSAVINPRTTHEEYLEENLSLGSTGPGVTTWCISGGGFPDWMSTPWGKTGNNNDGTILLYTAKDYNTLSRKTLYDFHNFVIGTGTVNDEYPTVTNLANESMFDKLWAPHISLNVKYASDMFTIEDQSKYVDITKSFGTIIPSGINKGSLRLKTNIEDGIYIQSKELNIDGLVTWEFGLPNLSFVKKNTSIKSVKLFVSTSEFFHDNIRKGKLRSPNIMFIGSEFMSASTDIGLNRFNDERIEEVKDMYTATPFTSKLYESFKDEYDDIVKYSNLNSFNPTKLDNGVIYVDWNTLAAAYYGENILNIKS